MVNELIIRWEINDISQLTTKFRYSPIHIDRGITWRLLTCTENSVRTKNINQFSLYLCCNEDNDSLEWSCDCSYALYIIHRSDPEKNHKTQEFARKIRKEEGVKYSSSRGEPSFYKFSEVLKRKEGFVRDDKLLVEARIKIKTIECTSSDESVHDFSVPSPNAENIALKFDNGTLHVCRRYLVWYSPYFAALLDKQTDGKDVEALEVNGVQVEDFTELLLSIFPSEKQINAETYLAILTLADRFQVEKAKGLVEQFLMKAESVEAAQKLWLADKYQMEALSKHCVTSFKTLKEMSAVEVSDVYSLIPMSVKVLLQIKAFDLTK